MLDRTRPPAFSQTFELDITQAVSEIHHQTRFHWLPAGNQPVFRTEILFPQAGSYQDHKPGSSYMVNKMITYGTASRSHDEITDIFDNYGAFINVNPSFDDPSIELYGLTAHAAEVLPVLADIVRHSVFPDREFELVRNISAEQMRIQNARNNVQASKLFRKTIFGDSHPYGVVMTPEDLGNITAGDLREFYHEHCRNFEVITTGNLTDELRHLLINELGKSIPARPPKLLDIRETDVADVYEPKAASLQTSLRIGKVLVHKSHEDYIPLRICLHALGGYFGSRLMKNIREEKGYTYGIYASLEPLQQVSYLVIGSEVQKDHRQDAINEVIREIRRMQQEDLPESELQMVRNHLLGSFQSDLSSPFSLADKFKGVYLFGMDYSYYDRLFHAIQTITPQTIREMANKYLSVDSLSVVSVG